jgi:IS5 family transposase
LKHRYQLGYETLCREVGDSISWRRFCRIGLDQPVPHHTTLARAGRSRRPRGHRAAQHRAAGKLRIDTTVVGATVAYPTWGSSRGGRQAGRHGQARAGFGGAIRTRVRDHRRAARRRTREVARAMRSRTGDAKQVVFAVTRQVAAPAEAQLGDTRRVVAGGRRALGRGAGAADRCKALADELQTTIARTRCLLDQASMRLAGSMPDGTSRLAGPARCRRPPDPQGPHQPPGLGSATRLKSPTPPDGIVCDYTVTTGNPPDAALLVPAVKRVIELPWV